MGSTYQLRTAVSKAITEPPTEIITHLLLWVVGFFEGKLFFCLVLGFLSFVGFGFVWGVLFVLWGVRLIFFFLPFFSCGFCLFVGVGVVFLLAWLFFSSRTSRAGGEEAGEVLVNGLGRNQDPT